MTIERRAELRAVVGRGLLIAVLAVSNVHAQAPIAPEITKASTAVIDEIKVGDTAAIEVRFDDIMRRAVPHDKFVSTMAQINAQFGPLQSCGVPTSRARDGLTQIVYRCEFANAVMSVRLSWTDKLQLAGLILLPMPPEAAKSTPLPAGVHEEAITTGANGWPLAGTVLVPSAATKPPIAVLVHGSGPNDRDETIGANRPFFDLALGLAAHGIATLRYDKRTFTHGSRFVDEVKNPTLDDEIIDDAVAALVLAARRRDVGPVFIVGHSQGAWLAPRIADAAAKKGVKVAGVVMLAAPITPFADLIVYQYEFIAHLPAPGASEEMLEEMKARRDNVLRLVRQSGAGTSDPAQAAAIADLPLPLNLPASLWLDLARYDPGAALLAQPALPALLTFGGRDFQVPIREKGLWETRLQGRAGTTIVEFPALNHLLIDGAGPMSPSEYNRAGHVSQALIDRVAAWIGERAARH
jgi:pimeloyl-ACP methyl ester carboxylesterase